MKSIRTLARPMLAAVFVTSGYGTLLNPDAVVPAAEAVVGPLAERIPLFPKETRQAVRLNSAVQVAAGALLSLGRLPRLSALALAATLVPTTYAGHRFWEVDKDEDRFQQRIHFLKNLSMLGGLLIAAADTGGRPSLVWRAEHLKDCNHRANS